MIQLIAVHMGGALPVVMELETGGLNFIHRHALENMPRSPSGVPELRGLAKGDGEVQFKFKVTPDKMTPAALPELLALWDAKFADATLKLIAKKDKAKRDAASAAGLWKPGVEKGDLNAMEQQCSPEESLVFQQALAAVTQKGRAKTKSAKAGKRAPKPKLLDAVLDATTRMDPLTGDRTQIQGAAEAAVTTLRAQELVAKVREQVGKAGNDAGRVTGPDERQDFADPLEVARQAELSQSKHQTVGESGSGAISGSGLPSVTASSGEPSRAPVNSPDAQVLQVAQAVAAHKQGRGKGPKLVEMSAQDLFRHLDKGTPGVFTPEETNAAPVAGTGGFDLFEVGTEAGGAVIVGAQVAPAGRDASEGATEGQFTDAEAANEMEKQAAYFGPDAGGGAGGGVYGDAGPPTDFDTFLEFDQEKSEPARAAAANGQVEVPGPVAHQVSMVVATQMPGASGASPDVEWSGLVSFRLDNHRSDAHAVILETGEVFEALGYLQIAEPLAVQVEWLQDAVYAADQVPAGADALRAATDWLRAELDWRGAELIRWMGKTDLVSPPVTADASGGTSGEKAKRITNAKKRPAGWVAKGCEFAALAQNISLDIAMLEMTSRDIDRALAGMPAWAIDAMQSMRAYQTVELGTPPAVGRSEPGAVFRDIWREELQRIDRWCTAFASIKIARQIGLFGSEADQRLLVRIEQLIERTRQWRAAPAQASRVLAVWLAFVLSLDHDNRPAHPLLVTADPAKASDGQSAQTQTQRRAKAAGACRAHGPQTKNTEGEACHV